MPKKAVRLLEVGMKLPKEVVICRKWPSECLKMFSRYLRVLNITPNATEN